MLHRALKNLNLLCLLYSPVSWTTKQGSYNLSQGTFRTTAVFSCFQHPRPQPIPPKYMLGLAEGGRQGTKGLDNMGQGHEQQLVRRLEPGQDLVKAPAKTHPVIPLRGTPLCLDIKTPMQDAERNCFKDNAYWKFLQHLYKIKVTVNKVCLLSVVTTDLWSLSDKQAYQPCHLTVFLAPGASLWPTVSGDKKATLHSCAPQGPTMLSGLPSITSKLQSSQNIDLQTPIWEESYHRLLLLTVGSNSLESIKATMFISF